jgi:pimeloyl-ACP methyl ester carboxylesterase
VTDVEKSLQFELNSGSTTLRGEQAGEGDPVVLLHGLTATRRYVVMGSRHLPTHGRRIVPYDARGHGESDPAPERSAYDYSDLVGDLGAVLDGLGIERAAIAGASMGAHTALAFALSRPERVSGLVLITPAFDPGAPDRDFDEWDALADGLEHGGVEGFLAAYDPPIGEPWRETVLKVARQRLERHRHPQAVVAALRAVPRSVAFEGLGALKGIEAPTLIVASRDEADPGHPLRVGEQYAALMPHAELATEERGKSPLAWQGARLSRRIEQFLTRV